MIYPVLINSTVIGVFFYIQSLIKWTVVILSLARFVAGFRTLIRMILIGHVTVEKQQQGGQGQTVTTPWGPTTQRVHQSIYFILMKKRCFQIVEKFLII